MTKVKLAHASMTEHVVRDLSRIVKAIDDFSKRVHRVHGVSGPQLSLLWELRESGRLTISQLAERMYLHPSTVSGIADRLEGKRLATRMRDTEDHRVVGLTITTAGLEILDTTPMLPRHRIVEALKKMPDALVSGLAKGLGPLAAVVEAEP